MIYAANNEFSEKYNLVFALHESSLASWLVIATSYKEKKPHEIFVSS